MTRSIVAVESGPVCAHPVNSANTTNAILTSPP
jgi:hypothetical protein